MLFRALPLLVALLAGGCAMTGVLPNWSSPDAAGPEPANYRALVAAKLEQIMGAPGSDSLAISGPKHVSSLLGASWRVCVRVHRFPLLPRYYAVFIQHSQVVDSRLSVLIDRCELQWYEDFAWQADLGEPAP